MLSFLLSLLAGLSFTILSAAPQKQFPEPLGNDEEEAMFRKYKEYLPQSAAGCARRPEILRRKFMSGGSFVHRFHRTDQGD